MTNKIYIVRTGLGYDRIQEDLKNLFCSMGLNINNPFSQLIKPGDTVLIKPNLVRDYTHKGGDFGALVTNGKLVNEIIEYVKIALNGTGKIIVGDSPVQDSNFERTLKRTGIKDAIDFRREYVKMGKLGIKERISLNRNSADYIAVDLGKRSALMDIIHYYRRFRVTQYSPEETWEHHNPAVNEYLIPRYALEADVIINLPKLKTHKKSGFTCAMKNLVGINGAKSWLPHYRIGSVEEGGDEYLNKSYRKSWLSKLIEKRNRNSNKGYKLILYAIEKLIRLTTKIVPFKDSFTEGSWYGNQTLPRMVLDLNNLIFYADKNGIITNKKQRKMFIIVDAVISGEGDGPMNPNPRDTRLLISGDNPYNIDYSCAKIIGYNPDKIPLLNIAKELGEEFGIVYEHTLYSPSKLFDFKFPSGWIDAK